MPMYRVQVQFHGKYGGTLAGEAITDVFMTQMVRLTTEPNVGERVELPGGLDLKLDFKMTYDNPKLDGFLLFIVHEERKRNEVKREYMSESWDVR